MQSKKVFSVLSVSFLIAGIFSECVLADGDFAKDHPRRAQVLRRERRQQNANNAAAVDGKITNKQARQLDREDRNIRRQEQAEAAANGGHITKAEQRQLNREENRVNRQRARDERQDAAAANGNPANSN